MGIGASLFLIAVGAILTWAVDYTFSGIDIHTVGVILMIIGLIGLVLSFVFWSPWAGRGGAVIDDAAVVDDPPLVRRRRVIRRRDVL